MNRRSNFDDEKENAGCKKMLDAKGLDCKLKPASKNAFWKNKKEAGKIRAVEIIYSRGIQKPVEIIRGNLLLNF